MEYLTNNFYFQHLKARQDKLNGKMAIQIR